MRIAYLTQSYPPVVSGAAVVAQGLAEGMVRRGHQVLVLTASETSRPYHIYKPGLGIRRYRSYPNPLRSDHHFALWPHAEIQQALRDFRPQVIHTHDPFQFGFSGLAYSRKAGAFSLLTAHQLPWFINTYLPDWPTLKVTVEKLFWEYTRRVLGGFNTLIAPTHTIAAAIRNRAGLNSQVIGYGLDPRIFHPGCLSPQKEADLRSQLGLPPHAPVLLYAGRLDLDKRCDLLVQAAARAMQNHPTAHLLVVGDGTEKLHLRELCAENGIGERSHFPGFIPREQVLPDIFRLAALFITASEIETQGLSLLEASACGLPVVAVAAGCLPEVIRDGVNGYLVPPGNAASLAARIETLLDNPALACFLGQAGHQLSHEFCLEKSLAAHETLYAHGVALVQPRASVKKTSWAALNMHE